jgi:Ferritin-like domain
MPIDDRALGQLVEQSRDLHADAMQSTEHSLDELVELGHQQRARGDIDPQQSQQGAAAHQTGIRNGLTGGGILAATAVGASLLGLTASAAFASTPTDIQMLQTSAAIENLAVSTYQTALNLPYIGGSTANPVVKAFAQTTMAQHTQHAQAFNSATVALGGKAQTNPDPKYLPVVNSAVTAISKDSPAAGALAVVDLAMTLENVAAETYVNNCSTYNDTNAKKITASIMGVEAQHVATLIAVKALLTAGAPQFIALNPMVVANLPAAAGSIGFPNAFYPTSSASPASQGAVQ